MALEMPTAKRVRTSCRLSALRVTKLKEPGLYEDGAGLRLVVSGQGTKRWALRLTINGRRVERGLGVWPDVSLEDARRRSEEMRGAARDGRDLQAERREATKRQLVTFERAFHAFFDVRRQKLRNSKHIQQWESTMGTYVFPRIGKRPVADITAAEVLAVLQPIWFTKPETAARVLQRLRVVFDSAILRGTRERANPCIGVTQELGTDHRTVRHHRAMHWREVPGFIRSLRASQASRSTALAFEFLILTAARSGEVRGALWGEIDSKERLWTIPGNDPVTGRRMKKKKTHVVPLSGRAMEVLRHARLLHDGDLIFPGTTGQPLSDNTLSKLLRDSLFSGTPHGFRSAFKDWCAENGVRDEVSEAALAHADTNKARAAYRRTIFLDERAVLMQKWADHVCPESADRSFVHPTFSAVESFSQRS